MKVMKHRAPISAKWPVTMYQLNAQMPLVCDIVGDTKQVGVVMPDQACRPISCRLGWFKPSRADSQSFKDAASLMALQFVSHIRAHRCGSQI